jgi:tetratricopeptide (TPR) repeat protein
MMVKTIVITLLLIISLYFSSFIDTLTSIFHAYTTLAFKPTNKNNTTVSKAVNHAPIVNVGPNQTVNENTTVMLVGDSSDPDPNDKLSYSWIQIEGPAVTLNNPHTATPSFTAASNISSAIQLKFALTAKDDKGAASNNPAIITVTVKADVSAIYDKGEILYRQGNYTQAVQYFDKALAVDPNYKDALNGKAYAFKSLGNYTQAIQYFDKALAVDPNYKDALSGIGNVFDNVHNYTQAIQYYDKALAVDDGDKIILYDIGNSYDGLGNYTQAIQYFDKALVVDPNYKYALNGKAFALDGLGNYTQAIQYYDKALVVDPNDKYASNGKQNALTKMGG